MMFLVYYTRCYTRGRAVGWEDGWTCTIFLRDVLESRYDFLKRKIATLDCGEV